MALINLSICLSDIPKEAIKQATNGKKYLSLTVQDLRETDENGNTHSVSVTQTKEQRERKEKKVYLGRGKEYHFAANNPTAEQVGSMPIATDIDDLPL